jgi:hypothetical protein
MYFELSELYRSRVMSLDYFKNVDFISFHEYTAIISL